MKQLIFSVKEIFTKYLDDKYFNIPEYQRGYKWDKQQIERLLHDIDKFKTNNNADKFYCLQNITIVENEGKNCFNVVDGQQRLTTLLVLLSYFDNYEIVKGKLNYSVRPVTHSFITDYILTAKIKEYQNWDSIKVIKYRDNDDFDHQDIYYLFSAYNIIKAWFAEHSIDEDEFEDKLINNVKLIVNKPYIDNEQELFMNLNTGKVSLDGADLVRALLVTNVAKEELENNNLEDTKSIVRINERRVRIGLELDEISAWWNQPNVRTYFSFLDKIKGKEVKDEYVDFNTSIHPINLLYKLYCLIEEGVKDKSKIRLQYFENKESYITLYKKIIFLHRTIKDWYQDCEIYHFVKYLTTHTDEGLDKIWNLWRNAEDRESFTKTIKNRVKESIEHENIEAITNLKVNWFDNEDLYKILIVLDMIQIIKSQKENNKLSFLEPQYFKPLEEDREHIFPQTPISQKDIDKPTTELKIKVEKYVEILKTVNIDIDIDITSVNWDDQQDLLALKNEISGKMLNIIDINSIGNLCLLHKTPNRSYGNELYSTKRFVIVQNTKDGEHIRPHTLNCFDKGFAQETNELDKWTNEDIKENATYIKNQITEFFK